MSDVEQLRNMVAENFAENAQLFDIALQGRKAARAGQQHVSLRAKSLRLCFCLFALNPFWLRLRRPVSWRLGDEKSFLSVESVESAVQFLWFQFAVLGLLPFTMGRSIYPSN